MRKLIFFSSIAIGCVLCWQIGKVSPMFGYFFTGVMVTLCVVLIALAEPKEVAAPQTTALTVQPEKWFVIEPSVTILPSAKLGRMEAGR